MTESVAGLVVSVDSIVFAEIRLFLPLGNSVMASRAGALLSRAK